jgi:8-oxo-dGTP diphosphatase
MAVKRKKRPQWLPVVAGILIKDGKVLLGQRPEHKSLPGLWEFPGGKIELGESPEAALQRELQEELGLDVDVGPLRIATTHNYAGVGVLLLFYEIRFWKGSPKPVHHLELKWTAGEDLPKEQLPEANRLVLPQIMALIAEPPRNSAK